MNNMQSGKIKDSLFMWNNVIRYIFHDLQLINNLKVYLARKYTSLLKENCATDLHIYKWIKKTYVNIEMPQQTFDKRD